MTEAHASTTHPNDEGEIHYEILHSTRTASNLT